MNIKNRILSAKNLQQKLKEILPSSDNLIIISAYISEKALVWLSSVINNECKVTIVSRLAISDIKRGSSDLKAVEFAVNNNWKIYRLPELHAKIYLIDTSKLFVGSSNCTSNGLKLYGEGNLESSVELEATESDLDFIQTIINKSSCIDLDALEQMKDFLSKSDNSDENDFSDWPEEIFHIKNDLWVSDLLWDYPVKLQLNLHDLELLRVSSNASSQDIAEAFIGTKIFSWLYRVLEDSEGQELYYGAFSALLHDELCDDPTPYRKNIKGLLSILFAYCEQFASHLIEIDTPRHSQRISLKNRNN